MATISVILNTYYTAKDNLYPIIVKLRSGSEYRDVKTGYRVLESQWDAKRKEVIKHPDKEIINARISDIKRELNLSISDAISSNKPLSLKQITKPGTQSYIDYLTKRADQYISLNQKTIAGRVRWAAGELSELFGNISFEDVDSNTLRAYHASLKKKNKPNTIHKRFAMLRQLFTNAVNEGVYIGSNPFNQYKVKTAPIKKDKLTTDEIGSLEKLKLKGSVELARDMFLLSYYAKGIRFENVVFLHSREIHNNRIYIKTNKGEKSISIELHPKLKAILKKYNKTGYIFPVVKDHTDKRKFLDGINVLINRDLKIAAAAAGITKNLSFHLARHSIAMQLKKQGVSTGAIQDILGHSSVSITERYLNSLDDESLDKEMDKVYKTK
jgi:integrase